MKSILLALAIATIPAVCPAQQNTTKLIDGSCGKESHIAEGPIGADLTERRSRFFCDALSMSDLGGGKFLMQFAEKRAARGPILAFVGHMDSPAQISVERVYFQPGEPVASNEGICKFFFDGRQRITSVMCAAKVDEADRRTVPVVVFNARTPF